MVVGFASKNGHRAVELFDSQQAYHLMTEGHLTETDLAVCAFIDGRTESVRPADDKRQVLAGRHSFLDPIGVFNRPEFASVLV